VNQEAPPTPSSVPTQQAPSLIQNYAQAAGAVSYQHQTSAPVTGMIWKKTFLVELKESLGKKSDLQKSQDSIK